MDEQDTVRTQSVVLSSEEYVQLHNCIMILRVHVVSSRLVSYIIGTERFLTMTLYKIQRRIPYGIRYYEQPFDEVANF
jgi:hypothetical protein